MMFKILKKKKIYAVQNKKKFSYFCFYENCAENMVYIHKLLYSLKKSICYYKINPLSEFFPLSGCFVLSFANIVDNSHGKS